jgi:hypothetical protein
VSGVSEFGIFESAVATEFDEPARLRRKAENAQSAYREIVRRVGGFLSHAKGREDFLSRVALVQPEITDIQARYRLSERETGKIMRAVAEYAEKVNEPVDTDDDHNPGIAVPWGRETISNGQPRHDKTEDVQLEHVARRRTAKDDPSHGTPSGVTADPIPGDDYDSTYCANCGGELSPAGTNYTHNRNNSVLCHPQSSGKGPTNSSVKKGRDRRTADWYGGDNSYDPVSGLDIGDVVQTTQYAGDNQLPPNSMGTIVQTDGQDALVDFDTGGEQQIPIQDLERLGSRRKTAAWAWDPDANSYRSSSNEFRCQCGGKISGVGQHRCQCGRTYNMSAVFNASKKANGGMPMYLCREVDTTDKLVLANRRQAGGAFDDDAWNDAWSNPVPQSALDFWAQPNDRPTFGPSQTISNPFETDDPPLDDDAAGQAQQQPGLIDKLKNVWHELTDDPMSHDNWVNASRQAADGESGTHGPYKIQQDGSQYKLVNSLGETKTTGSYDDCRQMQKALYANQPEAQEQAKQDKQSNIKKAGLLDYVANPELITNCIQAAKMVVEGMGAFAQSPNSAEAFLNAPSTVEAVADMAHTSGLEIESYLAEHWDDLLGVFENVHTLLESTGHMGARKQADENVYPPEKKDDESVKDCFANPGPEPKGVTNDSDADRTAGVRVARQLRANSGLWPIVNDKDLTKNWQALMGIVTDPSQVLALENPDFQQLIADLYDELCMRNLNQPDPSNNARLGPMMQGGDPVGQATQQMAIPGQAGGLNPTNPQPSPTALAYRKGYRLGLKGLQPLLDEPVEVMAGWVLGLNQRMAVEDPYANRSTVYDGSEPAIPGVPVSRDDLVPNRDVQDPTEEMRDDYADRADQLNQEGQDDPDAANHPEDFKPKGGPSYENRNVNVLGSVYARADLPVFAQKK